jgi:hypothetical protein
VPVPAQVGRVSWHYYHVGRPGGDLLLAARADVGLTGLRGVDAPHIKAERVARGGQVSDLLKFLELEWPCRPAPAPTVSRGMTGHA